ncbi:alanine--tRNA ligase-related protein [Patescibacteria group bacterium]
MKTELLYLENTYLFESTATFLETRQNEKGLAIILDKTIFYPQGGGQPTDTGYIRNNNTVFKVTFVGLDEKGVVWHFGEFEQGSFENNQEVSLEIDEEKRKLHTRIHSAGHLLDCAVQEMNLGITPDKGFHFVEGPSLESEGTLEVTDELKGSIEKKVNELVEANLKVNRENVSSEEAVKKGMKAPTGKDVRLIGFENYKECGCGGTHVIASADIGKITIRKMSSKKGRTKISYAVE